MGSTLVVRRRGYEEGERAKAFRRPERLPLLTKFGNGGVIMPWQYGKQVTGVWANYQGGNAWAWIDGLGWRKLRNDDDDATNAMFMACIHAKANGRNINFLEVGRGGNIEIDEIYVW